MSAMFRRPRPGGGRHPPPLAPTVSNFKPRAQWTNSGSSIFLYVNLPGFYRDQIEIKKDQRTRTVQVQGQRPLSTQTKARFNEAYRVPESCDMTKLTTSFSHGLLTIEFPAILEGEKQEKAVHDQGKNVQRSNQEESRGPGLNGSSLGREKALGEEKQVGTSKEKALGEEKQVGTSKEKASPKLNEEEPKTYKSVVEGKRAVPTGSREKSKTKVKAGEATPSLGGKERAKEEKVVERKEAAQMGQQKTGQKLKEDEARSRPAHSMKPKERVKEEKVVERKEVAQIGQQKIGQKLKEEEAKSTPTLGGSLKPKVRAEVEKVTERKKDADISQNKTGLKVKEKEITPTVDAIERKGDGGIGQKQKEEENINLRQKKQENHTKPVVGDEARRTEKKIVLTNQAEPELQVDADGGLRSKQDENIEMVRDKVSEEEIQENVKQKKVDEVNLVKETGDLKDNAEVVEPETGPFLVKEGREKTDLNLSAAVGGRGMNEEESPAYGISLVNVGVAALVIMGFGAYVFVPLVKLL